MSETEAPPGPRGLPIIGVLPRIRRDPLGYFTSLAAEYGPLVCFGNRRFTLYLLSDPAAIQRVFQGNAANYWKGEGLAAAKTVMGAGLATSDGDLWRRQRRLMQPVFQATRVRAFEPLLRAAIDDLFHEWSDAARSGEPRDVLADASTLVQRLLFGGLFGSDCAALDTAALGRALEVANDFVHRSAWSLLRLPAVVPTPSRMRFRRALALLDASVYRVIEERRRRGDTTPDLLGRLLEARMSDTQIRDEIMTLFMAGHDTLSAGIAWCLHWLASEPDVRARVAAEGADYARRVVQEALRLHPPGWLLVRTPRAADELCGYRLPGGAPILISQWVVHRRAELWPEPLRFDPDRFLPEKVRSRPAFAYFPYGGGSRTCIGNHLSDLALDTMTLESARRFRFEPILGRTPTPQPKTTLQPGGGVWLRLRPAD